MKFQFIFFALLLCLSGCSHIKIVGFDKKANTVFVQGGKHDSQLDVEQEAEKYCHGPVTLVSMEEKTIGSHSSVNAQTYGNYSYGSGTTSNINRNVYTFSCEKP